MINIKIPNARRIMAKIKKTIESTGVFELDLDSDTDSTDDLDSGIETGAIGFSTMFEYAFFNTKPQPADIKNMFS